MKTITNSIELEAAQALVEAHVKRLGTERVSMPDAHRRILAEDVFSRIDQPPFDRAPVDGFALRARDTAGARADAPARLTVAETLYAGDRPTRTLERGEAARIMTGAPIPEGADCVIRQEDTRFDAAEVSVPKELAAGDNYVYAGEDIKRGDCVLKDGQYLNYAAVGILCTIGVKDVLVYRKPRVGLVCTGDELVAPGTPLAPGKIYNSNAYTIGMRLRESEAEVRLLGIAPDDPDHLARILREALPQTDLIVTTGGASVGDKDIIPEALETLGAELLFHGLNMKPGSPALCGLCDGKLIVGLSGNPAAASITFELLVRVALARFVGQSSLLPKKIRAVLGSGFDKPSAGRRFLRGKLVREADREIIRLVGKNSSGVLSSLLECNCLVDVPPGSGALCAGDTVDALFLGEGYTLV